MPSLSDLFSRSAREGDSGGVAFPHALRTFNDQLAKVGDPDVRKVVGDDSRWTSTVLSGVTESARALKRKVLHRFPFTGDLGQLDATCLGCIDFPRQRHVIFEPHTGHRAYLLQDASPIGIGLGVPAANFSLAKLPAMTATWVPTDSTKRCLALFSAPKGPDVLGCETFHSSARDLVAIEKHSGSAGPFELLRIELSGRVGDIAVSSDRTRVAILERHLDESTIHIIQIAESDGKLQVSNQRQFSIPNTTRLAFHPNGKWLFALSNTQIFALRPEQPFLQTFQLAEVPDHEDKSSASAALHISAMGDVVAVRGQIAAQKGRSKTFVNIFDLANFGDGSTLQLTPRTTVTYPANLPRICWSALSPNGSHLATIDQNFRLSVRNAECLDLHEQASLALPAKPAISAALRQGDISLTFLEDGQGLAVGVLSANDSDDGSGRIILIKPEVLL